MTTTADLIDYYAKLLILQYRGQPKAFATIQALVNPVIMDQLPVAVQNAFTLGTAEGVQLDVIGKYAGVSRYGYDFSGPVTLSDEDFTQLIRIAIITNSSGSSLADIQSLLDFFFPGILFVFDHQDMRMSYFFDSDAGSTTLAQVFVKQARLPKPMGVQLATLIYTTDLKFFGMLSAKMIKAYSVENSVTIAQAANALLVAQNVWQFNSTMTPISGQWLSTQQGVV